MVETGISKMLLSFVIPALGVEAIAVIHEAQQQHPVLPVPKPHLPEARQRIEINKDSLRCNIDPPIRAQAMDRSGEDLRRFG